MAKVLNISKEDVTRITRHVEIQSLLSTSEDNHLHQLIHDSTIIQQNLFNTFSILNLNGTNILIKRINLASRELTKENFTSTSNFFDLPLYLHYGLNSPGFGAWRELSAATTATNWALAGLCPYIQMMYYWRVLPKSLAQASNTNSISNSLKAMKFWGDSSNLLLRYQENSIAEAEIVIFFEYIPYSLETWLNKKNESDNPDYANTFHRLDTQLTVISNFLVSHGMLHFDLNLRNILTDGQRLFISNFNLALSKDFDLSATEINFYNRHEGYDNAFSKACLIEWILSQLSSRKQFSSATIIELLEHYHRGETLNLPDNLDTFVSQYAELGIMMFDFFNRFKVSREARIELLKSTSSSSA